MSPLEYSYVCTSQAEAGILNINSLHLEGNPINNGA